jgi:succinate dehydrogenase/fumarate reductase iron-sulfur protein
VIFRIKRFDPDSGRRAAWCAYTVDAGPRMSVLDGLFWILEHTDGTLGFRYSCRAGTCGSCAMVINGREDLACRRRLDHMASPVSVEPLRSLAVIKDLVVDMTAFFAKYKAVDPFYVGEDPTMTGPVAAPAVVASHPDGRGIVDRQLGCISCGACYSACPVVAINPAYLGPAALNRAYVLTADVRDAHGAGRDSMVMGEGGVFACHDAGNCIAACPVGIQPLLSIQLLRKRAPR